MYVCMYFYMIVLQMYIQPYIHMYICMYVWTFPKVMKLACCLVLFFILPGMIQQLKINKFDTCMYLNAYIHSVFVLWAFQNINKYRLGTANFRKAKKYIHTYTSNLKFGKYCCIAHIMYICVRVYNRFRQRSLTGNTYTHASKHVFVCVLQNFALFASRLRKSSFISRQHLINNSKPITSLSSSSILWSLSSLTTTTTTKEWGEVMRGTFTVFFITFCDFWCDNDEKSPQASTSFQACVCAYI